MKKYMSMLLLIVLLFGTYSPFAVQVEAATFSDLKTSDYRYSAASWAVDNKLLSTSNGKFNAASAITEVDLLKMFAQLDRNYSFKNSNDPNAMVYNYYGALNIPLSGTYNMARRTAPVTRGQFAIIYAAMMGKDLSQIQAVRYLYMSELVSGASNKKTYEAYMPSKNLTRGDAAVLLYRMAKKTQLKVDGLAAKASGKDNSSITVPNDFVEANSSTINLGQGTGGTNATSPNNANVMKEVQSVKVTNRELIANGIDSTLVSIQLKDSYGAVIPNDTSLQFQVTSKLNNSGLVATGDDYFGKVKITTNPGAAHATTVWSDGGELSFYVTAPKLTKSYKDIIYVELVNNSEKQYASFKNKRIPIEVQYTPQPELRVSYQIYDAFTAEYVGENNPEQEKWAILPPSISLGPVFIEAINVDEKIITFDKAQNYASRDAGYEGAKLSLAGYEISEYLFERIVTDYFNEGKTTSLELMMQADSNGNAWYDLPFYVVPSTYTSKFATDDPQSYAVVAYLVSLLPSSINDFSMAYYDSVKKVQEIFGAIPSSTVTNTPALSALITPISGLVQLADTEYANQQNAQKAKETSHTKIAVSLVAPGGQVITNYRGNVMIEYNGVTQTVNFTSNTSDALTGTGHAGAAVAIFDGLAYGVSDVKVTLPKTNADTRYNKIISSLYNNPQTAQIFAEKPLDDRACIAFSEVAVVVDSSGSMNKVDPTNVVGRKAKELIKKMEADPSIAVRFNTKATLEAKGTSEQVLALGNGLFKLENRGGGTKMLEGMKTAISNFNTIGDRSIKKAIIVISDGKTKDGEITQMIRLAKESGIAVYTMTIGKQSETNQALMKRLALDTGGVHYHANSDAALSGVYQSIYDKVICSYTSTTAICTNADIFEQATVSILNQSLFLEAAVNANCSDVSKVKVRFYSVGGDLLLDLYSIGNNMYELDYEIKKINGFNIYEDVEFFVYDATGKQLYSKKVKVQ